MDLAEDKKVVPKVEIVEKPPEVDPEMKEAALMVMDILKDPEVQAKAKEANMSTTNDIIGNVMGLFQPLIDGQQSASDQRQAAVDKQFERIDKQLEGIGKLLMMCFKEIDTLRKNQYVQQQILEAIFKATVTDPAVEAARIDKLAGKKR